MEIVDTHAHVGQLWYEPVEILLTEMERAGVHKSLLVQYRGNTDNRYLMECVRRYPDRFMGVVWIDTRSLDATNTLAMWAQKGAVGVRLVPEDPLAIWRKASELGLPVSCIGKIDAFASDDFRGLVEGLPNLKIVLEHLGRVGPEPDYKLFKKVLALAEYPNVYIMLHGFGEILPRPFPFRVPPFDGPPPVVRMAYDAFTAKRMMWASDYPLSAGREGYINTLRFPMENISFFSQEDKEWVFGKTALSVFKPSKPVKARKL